MEEDQELEITSKDKTPLIPKFQNRSNTIFAGPTSMGKTYTMMKILESGTKYLASSGVSELPETALERVYILTGPQSAGDWEKTDMPFDRVVVTDEDEIIKALTAGTFTRGSLVVIDDMMSRFKNRKFIMALIHHFSVSTHRNDLWTFVLTQDYFHGDSKTWRRNAQNVMLFKSNKRGVNDLFQNLVPKTEIPLLMRMYKEATDQNFGALTIMQYKPQAKMVFYSRLEGLFVQGIKENEKLVVTPVTT